MSSTYDRRSRDRPLGITILCVLGFVGAFFSFFGLFGMMARGGPFVLVGLLGLAITVGKAAVLYGLWTLQHWGYKWALRFYALSAVLDLLSLSLVALVIDLLVVAYIASKADHFR